MSLKDILGEMPDRSTGVRVSQDELLLLDWVLSYPERQAAVSLDWHMKWAELRLDIWGALAVAEKEKQNASAELAVSEGDAKVLLAIIPTTFRWAGSGDDCGYSLKMKIARYLLGEPDDEEVQDASARTNPAKDYAES